MKKLLLWGVALLSAFLGLRSILEDYPDLWLIGGGVLITLFVLVWLAGRWRELQLAKQAIVNRTRRVTQPIQAQPYYNPVILSYPGTVQTSVPPSQATWQDLPLERYELL